MDPAYLLLARPIGGYVELLHASSDLEETKQAAQQHFDQHFSVCFEPGTQITLYWREENVSTMVGYHGFAIDDVPIGYEIIIWLPYWRLARDRPDNTGRYPNVEWKRR